MTGNVPCDARVETANTEGCFLPKSSLSLADNHRIQIALIVGSYKRVSASAGLIVVTVTYEGRIIAGDGSPRNISLGAEPNTPPAKSRQSAVGTSQSFPLLCRAWSLSGA